MANYQETQVDGIQWQRCNAVHIQNTYGRTPSITLQEEKLTQVGGQTFQQGAGGFNFDFNPAEVIELRDPNTGALTGGTMTMADMYVALWSLYMGKALARDAANAGVSP